MGIKKKLIEEMNRYVDRQLLPIAYEIASSGFSGTYEEFTALVRDKLKGEKEK